MRKAAQGITGNSYQREETNPEKHRLLLEKNRGWSAKTPLLQDSLFYISDETNLAVFGCFRRK
jgi:hypothetical protein